MSVLQKTTTFGAMKKKVAIIGGGTASLFTAAFLDTNKFDVTIFEKKPALGRKFLVAGDGGFNLTHSEALPDFKQRYTPTSFLEKALSVFNNNDLRAWLNELEIPTFVGTSGRVFPEKGIKPIQVLKAIENHLISNNIEFKFNQEFTGWNSKNQIELNKAAFVEADYVIFGLGGSSWKSTGSNGSWLEIFNQKAIPTLPFKASNCAYQIDWNQDFISKNEGTPLKNISISINGKTQKGEAVITKFGIEGNSIYALSPQVQSQLNKQNESIVYIDFKPSLTAEVISQKITNSNLNISKTLKEVLKLPKALLHLMKAQLTKEEYNSANILAQHIKAYPLTLKGSAPIEEAISTTGGIDLNAVKENFELKTLKNQFCIGEMMDWNAPTGGYLIQGCASSGVYLAKYLNALNES